MVSSRFGVIVGMVGLFLAGCDDGPRQGSDAGRAADGAAAAADSAVAGGCSAAQPCLGDQVCDDHEGAGEPTCVDRCAYDGCDSSRNCDLDSGLCRIAATCDSTRPDPGSCLYGQYCAPSDVCDYVPKATCANFTSGGRAATWNPSTSTGPIITSLQPLELVPDIDFCSNLRGLYVLAKARMAAYRTSGTFPLQEPDFLAELHLVKPDGTEATDVERPLAENYRPSDDARNVTVDLWFCVPGTPSEVVAGFQFTGGNEACVTVR